MIVHEGCHETGFTPERNRWLLIVAGRSGERKLTKIQRGRQLASIKSHRMRPIVRCLMFEVRLRKSADGHPTMSFVLRSGNEKRRKFMVTSVIFIRMSNLHPTMSTNSWPHVEQRTGRLGTRSVWTDWHTSRWAKRRDSGMNPQPVTFVNTLGWTEDVANVDAIEEHLWLRLP